ncbi:B-cell receptor CD22-like isoform X2 [Neoarius graeffei]|uniref:B-cell receptor CD22-like isoform X2 n=1 Tax=Neoarius graeffei TaxID=443677 RepID=UPI00298BCF22|nr:B-cell receptor CD22-like isoform X2 [Neoarius graeffei]
MELSPLPVMLLLISLTPVPTARGNPKAVVSIKPDTHVYRGERGVTLRCDIQGGGDIEWTFSWYKNNNRLSTDADDKDSTMQEFSIRFVIDSDSGDYTCRGQRSDSQSSEISDAVPLIVSGESPPVSLIVNPSRTQHFTIDSVSLSCEDQSSSTGWTVRRYTHSEGVSFWDIFTSTSDCSWWGSFTRSTCKFSSLSRSYTGVYWCNSQSGENSNPVNITVHDGDVILDSPVYPVTEGHPLSLRCLYRYPNSSNRQADFYKDGSVLQTQTTGEMIIQKVSKSDEGFYHCKHPEKGESPKSWVSVRRPSRVEAPFSVLMLICSVVTASPYLLATIILLVKCYRARAQTDEDRVENAVREE